MGKSFTVILCVFLLMLVESCSKKTVPGTSPAAVVITQSERDMTAIVKKNDSLSLAIKPVVKRKPRETVPKVITVNDKFANKSVDGRYYYDVQGHRYWRSNKDGKYYLFNKAMLTDDAFKKPN